ncbi:MAG: PAS domain-containing protein, partial [Ferruginibacter sp.]
MKLSTKEGENFAFLAGGGEMSDLIRTFDWANTPPGPIAQWPLSLRTTLGIMLHSAFPMFLFWGKDLTCFYNDAYRPSLGIDGKHPAIGKTAKTVWPDIWEFIGPLIEKVINTGKPVWFEDQFLPIYRNGRMEDVYWTFSYSPAYDDLGGINGVFVTCTETTHKVQIINRLYESETRFQYLIQEATVGIIVLEGEEMIIRIVNKAYGKLINKAPADLISKPLFNIIPETEPYFRKLIDEVRITGKPYYLYDYPYFIFTEGKKKEGFLNVIYQSYQQDGDRINGVMALCQDVTEQVLARKKMEKSEQQVRALVESAPFPIAVYEGREMRIILANQSIIDVWKKGNDVIGKLYTEILPELDNQEIFEQVSNVYTTGIPYHARNQRVDLNVAGKLQSYYFNYSFTPLFDTAGKIYGVMNTAAETTDLNLAKLRVERSEQNFRSMILQAPVAMCIMLGPSHVVEVANQLMIELWGKPMADVMNKPIFEGLPDAMEQGLEKLLADVYNTGETFKASERPVILKRNGKLETVYQDFAYEAYRDGDGTILGILAISIDVTQQVLARQKIEEKVAERTNELAMANSN